MKTATFTKTETEQMEKESDRINLRLNTIKDQLMNLRKTGYDTIIADIMIKSVKPKLAYYKATKEDTTITTINEILRKAELEIDDIKKQNLRSAKEEVEQRLREIRQEEIDQSNMKKDETKTAQTKPDPKI